MTKEELNKFKDAYETINNPYSVANATRDNYISALEERVELLEKNPHQYHWMDV